VSIAFLDTGIDATHPDLPFGALPLFRERMGSGDKKPHGGRLGDESDFRFSDTLKSARALGLAMNRKGSRRR
jgi:hypothetical protein